MTIDFTNIAYLLKGNERQQRAYAELNRLSIFKHLRAHDPILTGTIPLGIDLPDSDLDIICQCSNHKKFADTLNALYANMENYQIRTITLYGLSSTIASFHSSEFEVEIFGQDCPTQSQHAYRHMLIEHEILKAKDEVFRAEIIRLKKQGLKTEPAFAKLLGLKGNPYTELLQLENKEGRKH